MGNEKYLLRADFFTGVLEHLNEIIIIHGFLIKESLIRGFEDVSETSEMGGVGEKINDKFFILINFRQHTLKSYCIIFSTCFICKNAIDCHHRISLFYT